MVTNGNPFRHPIDDEPEPAAGACLRAALKLRWQAADLAGSTSAGIVRTTSELLDAVATATAADAGSVPDFIRRSATRLAQQIHQAPLRLSSSAPRRAAAGRSPDSTGPTDAPDRADADRLRLPPAETSGESDTIGPTR
jgi:hypothetical protein